MIAADGGAEIFRQHGLVPDYIIGDLDSFKDLGKLDYFEKSNIIEIEDQDTNDFEKCLLFAIEKSLRNILIVGFNGGELEHTLNNWSVLKRYSHKLNLCVLDSDRYGFVARESFGASLVKDEIISLIPQNDCVITTKNLVWELNNEQLNFGEREGARNKCLNSEVEILISSGELLIFIDSRVPFCPKLI